MPRLAAAALAVAIGAALSIALSSCGGSDAKLLPGNTGQEISENLDSVQHLVDEGRCIDAQDAALRVSNQVEDLRGIDPKLQEMLKDGAARLNEVVAGCEEKEETIEEAETVPETTEGEEEEEPKKKEKKPKKVEPEETQPEEEATKPPAEPKGHEEAPPVEEAQEGPSGGIGPGSAAGEGG